MDDINIRYGESVTLPLDTSDEDAVSADIFIGKPGEVYVLTKHLTLTNGKGAFEIAAEDTEIPLDTYYYQINVTDSEGKVDKFPAPEGCSGCDSDFPKFIVSEALDAIEIS